MKRKNSSAQNLKNFYLSKKFSNNYSVFNETLQKHVKKKNIVAAISGGPDSLALAAFCNFYSNENKNKIFYVLVNHNLRKNSFKEAKIVQKLFVKKKLKLTIINNKEIILKDIQNKARIVRYDLLSSFCKKHNIKFILTGHHSDDQIETFLIRLSRGSGVDGLSSMKSVSKLNNNIQLIRPLLNFRKEELIYITKKTFGKSIKDPSNKNRKFLRTKIRGLVKNFEKSGIHHNQIIRSIKNLASTKETIENYIKTISKKCLKKKQNRFFIDTSLLFSETDEVQLKILSNTIRSISRSYYPPRSKKILKMIQNFKKYRVKKATLGGCLVTKKGKLMILERESRDYG